jgi:DHA1 family bicyclomycin/chloramphenicol resistance-like MFS transporter/DHA1 family 2-module integral membrane pump EmrD-like MFS transporter
MKSNFLIFIIVLLIASIAGITSDIYAPSLPAISNSLSTPINSVQWSMAIYMLGLAISQLIYGPLSEVVGRKLSVILGLLILLIGSGICYFSNNIDMLILGRLIQGCGAGAAAALWRSIFRDVFSGEKLAKYGSHLSVFMVFVVPAAPAIGGYLQEHFNWRASFLFLCLYTLAILLLIIIAFKETSQHHHKSRLKISFILNTYAQLIKCRVFMGYSLCSFLSFGAFFSWFAVGPVLLIKVLGYSPIAFGWMSSLTLCGTMAIGSFLNGKLVEKFKLYIMLRFGWSLTFLAGAVMLLTQWLIGMNVYIIVGSISIFYLGSTFIFANTFAGAFAKCGKIAGFAGALYGALQIAGASALGGLVSYLPDNNQTPLACVYLGCSALAWIIYKKVVRPAEQ